MHNYIQIAEWNRTRGHSIGLGQILRLYILYLVLECVALKVVFRDISITGIVIILVCYLSSFPRSFNIEINYVAICSNSSHRLTGFDWTIVRMDGPMGGNFLSLIVFRWVYI